MKNRWLLNIVLIIIVGFGFYGITSAINMMATSQELQDHEFSYIKRTADQHWYNENYEEAARYFKQLADSDDTNCNAHFLYPYSLTHLIESHLAKPKDKPKMTELELEQCVQNAIDGYLEAIQFSQYRNFSRIRLSVLYGFVGEVEKSKELARAAYEDGRSVRDLSSIYKRYGCSEVHEQLMMEIGQQAGPTIVLERKLKRN